MPYCPECGFETTATAKFCKKCGHNLKAEEVQLSKPKINRPASKCVVHPDFNAVGTCTECGNGVCVLCKSGVKDKLYCPSCFERINKPLSPHKKSKEKLSQSKPIGKCATHPQDDAIGKCADCGIAICTICSTALADMLYCPSCIEKVISHTSENEPNLTEETLIETEDNGAKWVGRVFEVCTFFLLGGFLFSWAKHTLNKNAGRVYSTSFTVSKIDRNQVLEHDFWLFNRSNKSIQIKSIRIYRSDHNLIQVLNKEDIIRCWGKTEVEPDKEFNGTLNYPIPLKDKTRKKWYVEWNVLDAYGSLFTIKECYNIHDMALAKSRLKGELPNLP